MGCTITMKFWIHVNLHVVDDTSACKKWFLPILWTSSVLGMGCTITMKRGIDM